MLEYKIKTFSSGTKLITAPLKSTKAVTILFLIGTGSRFEGKDQKGISHFLEHMFFKGTAKRPTSLDITKALDSLGADYNAFTGEEFTGFYVRSASEHFDLALDILYDLLNNPKFDPDELEKEKKVVYEEINMHKDMPQIYIYDLIKRLLFGDHPLGWPLAGEKETLAKLSQQDLFSYKNKFYQPNNLLIAIAGDGDHEIWQEKISRLFGAPADGEKISYPSFSNHQTKPELLIHQKQTDQAHLAILFRTFPWKDPRLPILKVLNNLFGENMSSRLFMQFREKHGFSYYIRSEIAEYHDQGAFGLVAGVDIKRAEEAVQIALEEFRKLKEKEVESEELQRAKENLKGKLFLSLEESSEVAEFLSDQELFLDKIEDPEEIIAKYEKVTASEIKELANELFINQNLNLAMIGPFEKTDRFKKLLERF